ncbi:hypothetical protein SAMN05444166_1172 [Singulisphaera sp. GP187]|nr:hypothetical protein SAMN05444166_1172 [Singulisphaera sp. GP187]
MAAVAEPTGFYLAGDVHPGNAADDPLYLPLYRRVRPLLGQTALPYSGDCWGITIGQAPELNKVRTPRQFVWPHD